jgi:hypothetical protein
MGLSGRSVWVFCDHGSIDGVGDLSFQRGDCFFGVFSLCALTVVEPTNRHPERYDEPQRPTTIQPCPYVRLLLALHHAGVRGSIRLCMTIGKTMFETSVRLPG